MQWIKQISVGTLTLADITWCSHFFSSNHHISQFTLVPVVANHRPFKVPTTVVLSHLLLHTVHHLALLQPMRHWRHYSKNYNTFSCLFSCFSLSVKAPNGSLENDTEFIKDAELG